MNELRANCPGCGKPVVFLGNFSMSSICDACGMIVVRPDYGHPATRQGETIAAPIENDSPLELGMKGSYQGHHFEIRGVVRLEHDAGGFWDEWYLLFDDGRWGWLAEVQRHFYLTFAVDVKQAAKIPSFHEIRLERDPLRADAAEGLSVRRPLRAGWAVRHDRLRTVAAFALLRANRALGRPAPAA